MENLAHTLCGLRIADLGFREKVGPRAPWIAALAANLPDIDSVFGLLSFEIYLDHHRGFTHSFLGWPLFAFLGAFASLRLTRRGTYLSHLSLWVLGLLLHALLDWITVWGTQLFWPLSRTRFALDIIFIVDPMFWVLLGVLPWLLRRRGWAREQAAALSLFALVGWFLLAGMAREEAAARVEGPVHVFPAPLAPLFWTGASYEGDEVQRYWLTPFSSEPAGRFPRPGGEAARALREDPRGARRFWMARIPVFLEREELSGGGWKVRLIDLAYTSPLAPEQTPFEATFLITPEGKVTLEDDP